MSSGAAEGTLIQSRNVTDFRALDFEMPHLRRDLNDPDLVLENSKKIMSLAPCQARPLRLHLSHIEVWQPSTLNSSN